MQNMHIMHHIYWERSWDDPLDNEYKQSTLHGCTLWLDKNKLQCIVTWQGTFIWWQNSLFKKVRASLIQIVNKNETHHHMSRFLFQMASTGLQVSSQLSLYNVTRYQLAETTGKAISEISAPI